MSGQTEFEENIRKLRKALDDAEAVVMGAGAGLSASADIIYES